MARSQTEFKCLLVEENSILLVCETNVRLLKLQDANHEQDTDQPKLTCATDLADKQAKKGVACVGLNKNLVQSLQHVSVHYPAER